jgi:hypothetical protein
MLSLIRLFLYDFNSCSSRSCSSRTSLVFLSTHVVSATAAGSCGAIRLNSSTNFVYKSTFLPLFASAMARRYASTARYGECAPMWCRRSIRVYPTRNISIRIPEEKLQRAYQCSWQCRILGQTWEGLSELANMRQCRGGYVIPLTTISPSDLWSWKNGDCSMFEAMVVLL